MKLTTFLGIAACFASVHSQLSPLVNTYTVIISLNEELIQDVTNLKTSIMNVRNNVNFRTEMNTVIAGLISIESKVETIKSILPVPTPSSLSSGITTLYSSFQTLATLMSGVNDVGRTSSLTAIKITTAYNAIQSALAQLEVTISGLLTTASG